MEMQQGNFVSFESMRKREVERESDGERKRVTELDDEQRASSVKKEGDRK